MNRIVTLGLAATALGAGLLAPLDAEAFSDKEKGDIETIVRDYLVDHPEVLVEALNGLEAKALKTAIAEAGPGLFATPAGTSLGNSNGDVTVVEFFDYNCGYCRHALADMNTLIKDDAKLRFVLKEIPVLGDQSVAASRVSLAFQRLSPDRYGAFHRKLLGTSGVVDEDRAITVAESLGVTEADIRKAMAGPEIQAELDENSRMASLLKIGGTPSYVVLDEVVPGAIGSAGLAAKIANVRRCASASC